jgi:predicted SnoaL-like aldol condensation-catalyzing enzyme
MKKLLFAFLAFAVFTVISCSDDKAGGMSDRAKKNQETNQAILKMFETGDFSKVGDYIAADAIDHSGPQGEVKGLDSIKAMFQYFSSTMSDTKVEVIKELADDDYVMSWVKQSWTAKMDDPMMGMKAGDKGTMQGVEVTKYNADGKVTEHWGFVSMADMMKMMPQPSMDMNKMDTTAKK